VCHFASSWHQRLQMFVKEDIITNPNGSGKKVSVKSR
jgi:hypothetical protein